MASDNNHAELVASLKDAESEAKNGEAFFLVQLVIAATQGEHPRYSLKEVYEALVDAKAWGLLDPLNLLPLLVPSSEAIAPDLIQVIAREGNARETILFVQEGLERLERIVRDGNESNEKTVVQLTRLLDICRESIHRLQLRKKGPAETLQPVLSHLSTAVELVAPLAKVDDGRNIILSVSAVIQTAISWSSRNSHADDPHSQSVKDLLLELLCDTLTSCENHIHASLAQRRFEMYNPRLVLQTNIDPGSERGIEIMRNVNDLAKTLGLTTELLTSRSLSFGQLILLAHNDIASLPTSLDYFQKLVPVLTSSLQKNVAMDESLALLLVFLFSSSNQLPQEMVDSVATHITPLASTHPHSPTRHIAFRILAALLSRAPPPVHLAHLSSLLTDCPFPQMRVAAVGLVKEAFLNSMTPTGNDQSLFKSPTLIRALGPTIFRPDPPDLFASPTRQSLVKFLESSEPARLTECLAFYYVLIKRDTANSSGIRDRDMLRTVDTGLLSLLRNALMKWMEDPSCMEDPHALMPIASLETSLERVDVAIASLRSSS